MVNVTIYCEKDESADSMWRRFRKATDKAGLSREHARSRRFVPKSAKRKEKSSKARARRAKENGGA
jgi:ribosomal protein S21